jgi:hypothetical protein
MGIMFLIRKMFPDMSTYVLEDLQKIKQPRFMLAGDIGHWVDLRGQVNAVTGKINSYRDIRKICEAEGRTVPSLGSLRNYLGEGGVARQAEAKSEWLSWFEDFGRIAGYYGDEIAGLTTPDEWAEFRNEYTIFMGY